MWKTRAQVGWTSSGVGALSRNFDTPNRQPESREEADESVSLTDVPLRQLVELLRIELPERQAEPLLERGILPACRLSRVRNSPAGDPILLVERTPLALRRETARQLIVRKLAEPNARLQA